MQTDSEGNRLNPLRPDEREVTDEKSIGTRLQGTNWKVPLTANPEPTDNLESRSYGQP